MSVVLFALKMLNQIVHVWEIHFSFDKSEQISSDLIVIIMKEYILCLLNNNL